MYENDKIFRTPVSAWTLDGGDYRDIVLSSRIRLARNLEGYSFPPTLSQEKAIEVREKIAKALANGGGNDYAFYYLENVEPLERQVLLEKHVISPELVEGRPGTALGVKKDESIAIMVNEEDHLRIQCFLPGLQLTAAWQKASEVDDFLEAGLPYAYDDEMGYLTSCPTNIGTGLRASVMVHLPALALNGGLNEVLGSLGKLGLAVRGLYGEGSEAAGMLFQISNQTTLGRSEEEIIRHLQQVVEQVVGQEKQAREVLLKQNRTMLEDYVWRAYGLLRYARSLSSAEAMELLSRVRLGFGLYLVTNVQPSLFNQLLVAMQPAFLQKQAGRTLTPSERDVERAKLIRQALAGIQQAE
jgi:protein arginine kinase